MRHPRTTGLALGALATALMVATPAHGAAPTVELQPHELTRGPDIAIPHVEDGGFVDGERRVELPGTAARIIGESGGDWLVGTYNPDRTRNRRVVRVAADGTVTDLLRNLDVFSVILSADGSTLAWQQYVDEGRRVITHVASAEDGSILRSKGPNRHYSLLDVDADRVIVGGGDRVLQWKISNGRSRTIVNKHGGIADIEHDLLSIYTKDPYLGGCMKLVRLSAPRMKHWRSCTDRVAGFSPDGTRMLTFHLLTDGLGPGEIHLRELGGTRLATYTTGWFGSWEWEDPTTVLLQVNGRKQSSTVRCVLATCENATDPGPVNHPRLSSRGR